MAEEDEIERLKSQLQLVPHPSGYGAFREVWKGDRQVTFTSQTRYFTIILIRQVQVQVHKKTSRIDYI